MLPPRNRSACHRVTRNSNGLAGRSCLCLNGHPLVFRLPASTWGRATASMTAGLKSPTMNRQDRQMTKAIKRNPSPNEMRAPRLGVGPKPQNARIAKSKATAVHNILKNIVPLPPPISAALILGDDSAMVVSRVGGAYDTTTRSASGYTQTESEHIMNLH